MSSHATVRRQRRWLLSLIILLGLTACRRGPAEQPTATGGAPRGGPTEQLPAAVDRIEIAVLESFPVQVQLRAFGSLPDACTTLGPAGQTREGNLFRVTVLTERPAGAVCAQAQAPFEQTVALDVLGLPAGTYTVDVNGVRDSFVLAVDNLLPDGGAAAGSIGGIVWHDICAIGGGEGGATAVPSPGCVATDAGGFEADGVREPDEPGLAGVVVSLAEGACPGTPLATTTTGDDGRYLFTDLLPGPYCVAVDPLEPANEPLLIPGGWTFPAGGAGSATVELPAGGGLADVDFGWDYQFLPAPETAVDCTDRAGYVSDVTVEDNTSFDGGAAFVKTWRLRNAGSCTWGPGYSLIFAGGAQMGGPDALPVPVVAPGATVDLSVELVAPATAGTHRGDWLLRNPAGQRFGIGAAGDGVFWVQIVSRATTATPTPAGAAATPAGVGAINGLVWHDICVVTGGGEGGQTAVPSDGCTAVAGGGYQGNGRLDPGEPGIAGIEVTLSRGGCPGTAVVATTTTASSGAYLFNNVPAGSYCVSVDALSAVNEPLLIPGGWTQPVVDGPKAAVPVAVTAGTTTAGVNFGWDYQFD